MKDFKKDVKDFLKRIVISILEWEAKKVLKKYNPTIIAITGSVGKTSTKDAVYAVLSNSFYVRKSEKSFNSEIGIPLTILGCDNAWGNPFLWAQNILEGLMLVYFSNHYPKMLVLEVGADRPGDIQKVTTWLKPDVAVITQFADVPAHIEYFGSPEKVFEEKTYLAKAIKPTGLLVLNHDDPRVFSLHNLSKGRLTTYGTKSDAEVGASQYELLYSKDNPYHFPEGITFKITHSGSSVPVSIKGVLGEHLMYPTLVAISVGLSFGLGLKEMSEAFSTFSTPNGRMKLLEGKNQTLLIDDTYNSSPIAVLGALQALSQTKGKGRKIAVLGDMLELGKYSAEEHFSVGKKTGHVADLLIVVGLRAKKIAEGARAGSMDPDLIFEFTSAEDAGLFLSQEVIEGDILLIKGSQGMHMEKTVLALLAHPEEKDRVLVRQEKEWKGR